MPLKNAQVYVIDDDAESRESVAALVRTLGLEVQEFDAAEAFLLSYSGTRPACVVADLRLLGMSGLELLQELRRRDLSIPVILLTAHADTPTTVQAMKQGAYTTLDKPCRDSELWNTIRAALKDDQQRSDEDERRHIIRERLKSLTPAEQIVMTHLLVGDSNKIIALTLDIGLRTVEGRRRSVFNKMQVNSIAELVQLVMLVEPELIPTMSAPLRDER